MQMMTKRNKWASDKDYPFDYLIEWLAQAHLNCEHERQLAADKILALARIREGTA